VGCHVTTSCSTTNIELCKSLGADRVVDYKKESVVEALLASGYRFNHAVDNVGTQKEVVWRSHEYMKPGSTYMAVGGEISFASITDSLKRKLVPGFLGGLKRNVVGFWPTPKPEDLQLIGEWMNIGKVKAVIDQKFLFEEAPQAFERLKTGRARGKIVVDVALESHKKASA